MAPKGRVGCDPGADPGIPPPGIPCIPPTPPIPGIPVPPAEDNDADGGWAIPELDTVGIGGLWGNPGVPGTPTPVWPGKLLGGLARKPEPRLAFPARCEARLEPGCIPGPGPGPETAIEGMPPVSMGLGETAAEEVEPCILPSPMSLLLVADRSEGSSGLLRFRLPLEEGDAWWFGWEL